MACSMRPGRPLHSKTTLGPPPVASTTPAAMGPLVGSKAAEAPSRRASSRRRIEGSLTTATSTPIDTAQATAARPIGPAPRTATRSRAVTWPRRNARRITASGSTRGCSSEVTLAGSLKSSSARTVTNSAKPPGRSRPISWNCAQWSARPARQKTQSPHPPNGRATTAVPAGHAVGSTPEPTADTSPAISWPRTAPGAAN